MSKLGHLSWIGCLGHELVKIYQTFSAAHADFIEQVSRDPALREYFPEVINRCNEYLVVRWIEGANLRPSDVIKRGELLQKMAELQVALHSRRFPVAADCFNYLTWLRNRCRRYLGPFTHNEPISNMMEMIEKYEPEPTAPGVCHPDVTPRNLVVEKRTGKLKLVDNELLNQGWFCLIDLFNTHASLGGSEDIANR
jgi:Ser/Thr protein kinase RdoA (MazF antagonist)